MTQIHGLVIQIDSEIERCKHADKLWDRHGATFREKEDLSLCFRAEQVRQAYKQLEWALSQWKRSTENPHRRKDIYG